LWSEPAEAKVDWALVRRAQAGDNEAFAQLVERYQRKAFCVAIGLVGDRAAALAVAQESFVEVYKYLSHFKGESSFYTWLYRITVELCRNRSPHHRSPDLRASLADEHAVTVGEALQQLPDDDRAMLILREVDGLSYEEIAAALRVPKAVVSSRLFTARAQFKSALDALRLDPAAGGAEET